MKNKSFVLLAGLILLSVVLTACAAPKEANFPTGKFVRKDMQAKYYLFNADGSWELYDGFFRVASGTYEVDGDVYTDISSDTNCGPQMSFNYVFDGTNLTFNYVDNPKDDLCINRTWEMDNVTYILSEE